MDKQLKVYLNLISKFLEKEECPEIEIDFDSYSLNSRSGSRIYCNGKYITLPIDISKPLEQFMESIGGELDTEIDDSEVYQHQVRINTKNRTLTVVSYYTIYGADGPYEEYDEGENAIKSCEQFIKDGYTGVLTFDFHGGGDSGYVEEIGRSNTSDGNVNLNKLADDVCYSLLSYYGGWEINEGSQGQIYFHLDKKMATIELTWNTEEAGEEEQGVWHF